MITSSFRLGRHSPRCRCKIAAASLAAVAVLWSSSSFAYRAGSAWNDRAAFVVGRGGDDVFRRSCGDPRRPSRRRRQIRTKFSTSATMTTTTTTTTTTMTSLRAESFRDTMDHGDWPPPLSSGPGEAEPNGGVTNGGDDGGPDVDKLRELQIAFEFDRVQSSLPDAARIRGELESRFGVSTKYFLGTTEMAYALAVSRVDDAIERRRLGTQDEGCVVGDDYPPSMDGAAAECATEDDLPTPEELIAMEYANLEPWDVDSLSGELESQYGIPAKHFMGKKEMAYALAVERVDRAMKEGAGLIYDDPQDESKEGGEDTAMTDEDMMRLMEEEMRKEDELERVEEEQRDTRARARSQGDTTATNRDYPREGGTEGSFGGTPSVRDERRRDSFGVTMPRGDNDSFGGRANNANNAKEWDQWDQPQRSVRDTPPSRETFPQRDPDPYRKKTRATLQSTPLADMIKDEKRGKSRPAPKRRTPLSSEQHSFQRQQGQRQQQGPGSVVREMGNDAPGKEAKSLADILKGSERRGRARSSRTWATPTPPPPPATHERPRTSQSSRPQPPRPRPPPERPRSSRSKPKSPNFDFIPSSQSQAQSKSKTNFDFVNTSRFDESFSRDDRRQGGGAASGTGRGYSTSWDKQGPKVAFTPRSKGPPHAASSSSAKPRGGKGPGASQQRPFEPAPFTEPGTHSSVGGASPGGPKRVPPRTPFQSPVTGNSAEYGRPPDNQGPFTPDYSRPLDTQGPFTPFTPPGKRSAAGAPPPDPKRGRRSGDPRGFNIRDTPDAARPFAGSPSYSDFGFGAARAPPLQVEPPPADPARDPRGGTFEPAPFSGSGGSSAAGPRAARAPPRGGPAGAPPPPGRAADDGRRRRDKTPERRKVSSSSPFDNLKDIFGNIGKKKKEREARAARAAKEGARREGEEEPGGFKSGNVEVFPSPLDGVPSAGDAGDDAWQRQEDAPRQSQEADIIDAEMETGGVGADRAQQRRPSASHDTFSNAWKGGAEADGANGGVPAPGDDCDDAAGRSREAAAQRARLLLSSSPEARSIVAQALSDPRLREAVLACGGDPSKFGAYLEDAGVGPVLRELRDGVSRL